MAEPPPGPAETGAVAERNIAFVASDSDAAQAALVELKERYRSVPANEADVEQVDELLHGKEQVVHADAGYTGAQTRVSRKALRWEIAAKRGRIQAMKDGRKKRALERIEKRKASIRAKVEHPFRVIKCQFGLMKVRFRGLAKNTAHLITLFALSNLWMARRRLLAMSGALRPQVTK